VKEFCEKSYLALQIEVNMRYLVIVVFFFSLISCSKRARENSLIDQAEKVVGINPDSSIFILQGITEQELLTDSLKAKYWLVTGQAHYNSRKSMLEDSLILYSFNYYSNLQPQNVQRLLQSYKLLGNYLWWNGRKEEAGSTLSEGVNIAENGNDTISYIHLLKSIININLMDNKIEKTISYIKKLIDIDHKATDLNQHYNELGIMYYYINNSDSSLYYLEKSMSINSTDSALVYNYMARNYADILSDFGFHRKAIEIQKRILKYYICTKNEYESLSYISLSRYYLNIGKTDSSFHYMKLAENTYLPYIDEDLSLSNYYTVQKTILDYVKTKEFKIRQIAHFSNNMFDVLLDRERIIQGKNESERLLEKRNLNLLLSKQRNQFLLILMTLGVLIFALVISIYIQRRKKVIEEKEEELEALKKLISDSQKTNNKDDKFFKKILLQQLGMIKLVATNPTSQNQVFLQQMQKIANKDIPVEDLLNWDDLYAVIDNIYGGYYSKIYKKYADLLSNKEYQLCCLLKAEFSTKEISVVTQQSIRTIYQRKSTIRQKLAMNEKEDIVEYLDSIV